MEHGMRRRQILAEKTAQEEIERKMTPSIHLPPLIIEKENTNLCASCKKALKQPLKRKVRS